MSVSHEIMIESKSCFFANIVSMGEVLFKLDDVCAFGGSSIIVTRAIQVAGPS